MKDLFHSENFFSRICAKLQPGYQSTANCTVLWGESLLVLCAFKGQVQQVKPDTWCEKSHDFQSLTTKGFSLQYYHGTTCCVYSTVQPIVQYYLLLKCYYKISYNIFLGIFCTLTVYCPSFNQSVYQSIQLSVCLPVSLSVCLPDYLLVSWSVCVPICLAVCLCLFVTLSACLCLPFCVPACLFVSVCHFVCVPVSVHLFISHSVQLPACLFFSVCLSVTDSLFLSACDSVCSSQCLPSCHSLCVPVFLSF